MFEQKARHIDLKLPRSWNQCTTDELETIAACILRHVAMQDRYHPFDWLTVKTELFFLLTGLEMVGEADDPVDDDPDERNRAYLVRRNKKEEPFPIYIWQVQSFVDQHLAWIDDEKQSLIIFPYKQLLGVWRLSRRYPFIKKQWLAPGELLQDFSWREYRHLQDYMEMYVRLQNQMTKMQQGAIDKDRLAALARQMLDARNNFLAVLFKVEGHYPLSTIHSSLNKVGPVQWQVILFWWSGFMRYLQKQFPHCFKSSKKTGKRPPLPIELYRSIITTVQKESNGLTEDEVNGQTFYIVLEHLERLAKQNEEMEKISKKHR
jgi:hypothetical protein